MAVLGLIAGSGPLPFEVAEAARAAGTAVAVAAIENNTDAAIEALASDGAFTWVNAGELEKLLAFFKEAGVGPVILAGAVSKREILRDPALLRPDARALGLLARVAQGGSKGDDALLRAIADELESEGLEVVDSTIHLGERMTSAGLLAGPEPDEQVEADVDLGMRVIETLGPLDVGQAVLVHEGVVLAIEAIEGTDAMVERGATFGRGAVLVKAAKPGQDMRFDVPVIGPDTVARAQGCGLRAIALEAGRTLILERERTLRDAAAAGISLLGRARRAAGGPA